MLGAVVMLPLLLMILCYGIIAAILGSVTNTDAKKDNIPSFVNAIVTPILLGLVIFLKTFISPYALFAYFESNVRCYQLPLDIGILLCMHGPLPPPLLLPSVLNAPDTNVGVWGVVHMQ